MAGIAEKIRIPVTVSRPFRRRLRLTGPRAPTPSATGMRAAGGSASGGGVFEPKLDPLATAPVADFDPAREVKARAAVF